MRLIADYSVVSNDGGTVIVVDEVVPGGCEQVIRAATGRLEFLQDGQVIATLSVPDNYPEPLLGVCEMDAEAGVLVREHPLSS